MTSNLALRAGLLSVALAATACSKDGGSGSDTDATTTGTTTTTSAATTTGTSTTTGGTSVPTGSTSTTTGGTSVPTGGSSGFPAECACLEDGCGPSICPVVAAGCPVDCPTDFSVDEAALTCALEALRDGAPGTITWSYTLNDDGANETGWISILPDRAAIRGVSFDMIVCSGTESTIRGPLPGPAVYEACLADPSPAARFDCARQVLADIELVCAPPDDGCD